MANKEGSLKEELTSKEPEGNQDNEKYGGFRARKDAMHSKDGKSN